MHVEYSDILERAGAPDWYDEHGTPRYGERHPRQVTVYGNQAVFFEIACQVCGERFIVSKTYCHTDWIWGHLIYVPPCPLRRVILRVWHWIVKRYGRGTDLIQRVSEGWLHYGDPPYHGCAYGGETTNCEDIRVLEFWRREGAGDWERVPELEIALQAEKEETDGH